MINIMKMAPSPNLNAELASNPTADSVLQCKKLVCRSISGSLLSTYFSRFCLQPESLTVTHGPTLTMFGDGSSWLSPRKVEEMEEMHKKQIKLILIIFNGCC